MISPTQESLYEHGIQTENSDIRAHVAPGTRAIYVFRTQYALDLIASGRYPIKVASQPGVEGITGRGYIVPWHDITDIRRLRFHSVPWWEKFSDTQSTSEKGKLAVDVVSCLLQRGLFPLWCIAPSDDTEDVSMQIKGTDIVQFGKWRIQGKCDYYAGEGGTGNLFLQIAERNPMKRI